MTEIPSYIKGFAEGIKPIKRMTVSQWAEKYRYLSAVSSSEPGRWKNSRTPYLVEIMDRMGPYDECQRLVFMKGSQVGVTEASFNAMGFYIDNDPCPLLYVMPTEQTVKRNSRTRFDPMISSTPSLSEKVAPMRSRDKQNSVTQKSFTNGTIVFCGANSPAPLRSLPVRVCILDEVDAMPASVEDEGSPIELAEARTRTFPKKKMIIISTPTTKGASMIEDEYLDTSQKKYFVPCPNCGEKQELIFEQLRWEPKKWANTTYECIHCEHQIEERNKNYMLKNGEWIDTAPELFNPKVLGYHINALYSPWGWYSWGEAAEAHYKSQGKPEKEKVFQNTVLGLTYEEKGDSPEYEKLFNRNRSTYPAGWIEDDVQFLTIGVDIQSNRIECETVGWCKNMISKSIQYNVFVGETNTEDSNAYKQLSELISKEWVREDGVKMRVSMCCVDSGYNANTVYSFCRTQPLGMVVPIKGRDSQKTAISTPSVVDVLKNGQKYGAVSLYNLGVDLLKRELYGWLKSGMSEDGQFPRGYCFFPKNYDETYFLQLTAEKLVRKDRKGYAVYSWQKVRKRNEALDCRIYARAAAAMIGLDVMADSNWDIHAARLKNPVKKPKKAKKRDSGFWKR